MSMIDSSKQTDFLRRRLKETAVILLAAGILAGQDAPRVGPLSVRVDVDVMANPSEGQKLWRASRAWLEQTFQNTGGYVRVTNASAITFNSARFYAEYYDDAGRLCFTLVFVQDKNLDGIRGPFHPGDTRRLAAYASVSPAVRPRKVRLWFLGEADAPLSPQAEVIAPVTIRSGTIGELEGIRLSEQPNQPLMPFALVEATSDSRGKATTLNVVAAWDDASRRWAGELAARLRFAPATQNDEPMGARTLILIRVLRRRPPRAIPGAPAFENPWVQTYLAASDGKSGPPIVNLLHLWSEDGSDMFDYFSIGTDWCLSVFRWVYDPIRRDSRREWLPLDEL